MLSLRSEGGVVFNDEAGGVGRIVGEGDPFQGQGDRAPFCKGPTPNAAKLESFSGSSR